MSNKRKVNSKVASLVAGMTVGTMVAIATGVPAMAAPLDSVTFNDSNLKTCIADSLGVSPSSDITEGQLEDVVSLICSLPLSDLQGVEHLTNLNWFTFNGENVIDLAPLTDLNMTTLEAYNLSQVTDLTPLRSLDSVENLKLTEAVNVKDYTPLSQLNLTSLNLGDGVVGDDDLVTLSALRDLQDLQLYDNQISDIAPLANLTNLRELNLHNTDSINGIPVQGNTISDVSPLSGLMSLDRLDLAGNNIENIDPLAGLDLEWLYLNKNKITDISSLDSNILRNLTLLDVKQQRVDAGVAVEIGDSVPFNVTTVGGDYVPAHISPITAGTYDPTTRSITYTESGDITYMWSVPVSVGNALATFSGIGLQVVNPGEVVTPVAPANTVATAGENPGEVTLSWDAVTESNGNGNIVSYDVEYRQTGTTEWLSYGNVSATETVIEDLTPGVAYEFRVAAVAANDERGAFSATISATATPDEVDEDAAPAVTGVTVTGVTNANATISWNPVTDTNGNGDVVSYSVSIGTENSGYSVDVDANITTLDVTVIPNITYGITVSYTTTTGATGRSANVEFTTPDGLAALGGLSAEEGKTQGTVDLSWIAVNETVQGTGGHGEVVQYNVRYRAVGSSEWLPIGKYAGDGDLNTGQIVNLASGEFEIAISYTTDTETISPEAYTTVTVTNGIPNGADGTVDGETDKDTVKPDAKASAITPTGMDNTLIVSLAALSVLAGAGALGGGYMIRRRKESV